MARHFFAFIALCTISQVAIAELSHNCSKSLIDHGIDFSSFPLSIAHGIHSITIEQLKHFFGVHVPSQNGIPTVNSNLTGDDILPNAPRLNNDQNILSLEMKIMDFIISNNDDPKKFFIRGLPILEKIAHEAHMNEIYVRANRTYWEIAKTFSNKNQFACSCIANEKKNGILDSLKEISHQIRNFAYNLENDDISKVSLEDSSATRQHAFPRLKNCNTWKIWKKMLNDSMLSHKEIFNLSYYLYCKLNAN